MSVKKQKYRRLQVDNIALRTVFEIAALIIAIIICCTAVISSYEASYASSTTDTASLSAMQLAHNISAVAEPEALKTENAERRDYIKTAYSQQLEKCFISEDVQYSGGIYAVNESEIELFSASAAYDAVYKKYSEQSDFTDALLLAAAGERTSINIDDNYIAFYPVTDKNTGAIYAISSASVDNRSSTEFDSPVKDRIVLISVVSGVLIIAYFAISGVRSERKKVRGEAV